MSKKLRPTLLQLGTRGDARRVRVYEDRARGLVTVVYAQRQKRSWPRTTEGRAEAIAWAQGFHEARTLLAHPVEPVTVHELFARYGGATFGDLRPKTVVGHRNRWRLWEAFIGHDRPAADVTLEHLDTFKAELLAADFSPYQVAAVFTLLKAVFRWGVSRKLAVAPDVAGYRLRLARDLQRLEPDEYRLEEFERLVPAIGGPQDSRTWRAWAVLMLVGHQGVRINAALHLQWADVGAGELVWRAAFDKRGREWRQPLRDGALSALLTAERWRARDGYGGPWVFYSPRKRRQWAAGHGPYRYSSFLIKLLAAERAAGVVHRHYRGAHGFRKMVAGEILALTGNPKDAMDFIGDQDLTLIKDYLKARADRKGDVAALLDTRTAPELHPSLVDGSVVPEGASAKLLTDSELPESHRSDLNRRPLGTTDVARCAATPPSADVAVEKLAAAAGPDAESGDPGAPEVHPAR